MSGVRRGTSTGSASAGQRMRSPTRCARGRRWGSTTCRCGSRAATSASWSIRSGSSAPKSAPCSEPVAMTTSPDRAQLARLVATFDRRSAPLDGRKAAAVAVVVIGDPKPGGDGGVILTKRAPRMRAHAGQWALPGGRIDAGETAALAAVRELHEELGLGLDDASVLGALDDYPTRSGYRITPVVMWLAGGIGELAPNPHEVASVHVATWEMLTVEPIFLTIPESDRPVIQLPMLGTKIHAPTAAVLYQFRELALFGRTTRIDGLEQPTWAWR